MMTSLSPVNPDTCTHVLSVKFAKFITMQAIQMKMSSDQQ